MIVSAEPLGEVRPDAVAVQLPATFCSNGPSPRPSARAMIWRSIRARSRAGRIPAPRCDERRTVDRTRASRAMESRSATHSYVSDDGSPLTSSGNSTPVPGSAKRRRTSWLAPNALSDGAASHGSRAPNGAMAPMRVVRELRTGARSQHSDSGSRPRRSPGCARRPRSTGARVPERAVASRASDGAELIDHGSHGDGDDRMLKVTDSETTETATALDDGVDPAIIRFRRSIVNPEAQKNLSRGSCRVRFAAPAHA